MISRSLDLFFDTVHASYKDQNNPARSTFQLPQALTKVRSIALTSFQMGILFPNVRAPHLNTLSITLNGVTTEYSIPERNLTAITTTLQLLDETTEAIGVTWTMEQVSHLLSANANDSGATLVINPTFLSVYMLGFSAATLPSEDGLVVAASPYSLNLDNYFNFTLQGIPLAGNSNVSSLQGTFRVLSQGVWGQIITHCEALSFPQKVWVTQSDFTLSQVRVVITDRFGQVLTGGADFSFTLRAEVEG